MYGGEGQSPAVVGGARGWVRGLGEREGEWGGEDVCNRFVSVWVWSGCKCVLVCVGVGGGGVPARLVPRRR